MPLIRKGSGPPASPASVDRDATMTALRAGTREERWDAARALAMFPEAAAALGEALSTEADQLVREAICTALVRINSADSVDAILPHLRSDDANLRTDALDALKAMPVAAQARFQSLLRDPDPDVRILGWDLVRETGSADATRRLAAILDAENEVNVCAAAIEALAEIGAAEALPALTRCAERFPDQPFLSFAAKAACERIGSQAPRPHD